MSVIFLDRDGVINENRSDYVKNLDEFRFLPGACEAIAKLTHADYRIFVCTNQAGIARGHIALETLNDIHHYMLAQIAKAGGIVEKVYYCPHSKDERCACRKPQPGMLLNARDEFGLDLSRAIFVGDSITDVNAGLAAGVQPILVLTGLGAEQMDSHHQGTKASFPIMESLTHVANTLVRSKRWTESMAAVQISSSKFYLSNPVSQLSGPHI